MSGRFCVGDRIPLVLTKAELADGLGYSESQIDEFRRAKNHPAVKQLEGPGHPRFDGRAVARWLEHGAQEPSSRVFGRRQRALSAVVVVLAALIPFRASAQSLYGPPFLQVPAWTPHAVATRYPSTGAIGVGDYAYLAGTIGLNSQADASRGVVTFVWTLDAAGTQIVGVQGMPLSSLIPSLNQIRLPNLGPFLYATYQPFVGTNQLAATLFGMNASSPWPEIAADTIFVDAPDQWLGPRSAEAIYPADYFAGQVRLYVAGATATVWAIDLTGQFWPLDTVTNGSITTVTPMGTWFVVVSNQTDAAVTYTVAATPLLVGQGK